MKDKILKLKAEGKTYRQISQEVKCSTATVSYYCSEGGKERASNRRQIWRKRNRDIIRKEYGNCCKICRYNRCLNALHFHHLDSTTKEFGIMDGSCSCSIEVMREEAKKCILVCGNCHVEIHEGLISPLNFLT